jgi:hypothetical protein
MKTFKIPVTWEVYSTIDVEAETLEEAVAIFDEEEEVYPLPTDPEYIDGSFHRDPDVEEIRNYN